MVLKPDTVAASAVIAKVSGLVGHLYPMSRRSVRDRVYFAKQNA
jgi:hypothetical protein